MCIIPKETEFRVLKAIPRVHSGPSQTHNICGNKKVTYACLSMSDLFVTTRH